MKSGPFFGPLHQHFQLRGVQQHLHHDLALLRGHHTVGDLPRDGSFLPQDMTGWSSWSSPSIRCLAHFLKRGPDSYGFLIILYPPEDDAWSKNNIPTISVSLSIFFPWIPALTSSGFKSISCIFFWISGFSQMSSSANCIKSATAASMMTLFSSFTKTSVAGTRHKGVEQGAAH